MPVGRGKRQIPFRRIVVFSGIVGAVASSLVLGSWRVDSSADLRMTRVRFLALGAPLAALCLSGGSAAARGSVPATLLPKWRMRCLRDYARAQSYTPTGGQILRDFSRKCGSAGRWHGRCFAWLAHWGPAANFGGTHPLLARRDSVYKRLPERGLEKVEVGGRRSEGPLSVWGPPKNLASASGRFAAARWMLDPWADPSEDLRTGSQSDLVCPQRDEFNDVQIPATDGGSHDLANTGGFSGAQANGV
jgi:hypothetical protein